MMNGLQRLPAERELKRKRAELRDKEASLAESEIELAAIHAELGRLDMRGVTDRYARLYRIDVELRGARGGDDRHGYAEERGQWKERPRVGRCAPTPRLKALYRDVVRSIHPDLAVDPEERMRRTEIMIEINLALGFDREIDTRTVKYADFADHSLSLELGLLFRISVTESGNLDDFRKSCNSQDETKG